MNQKQYQKYFTSQAQKDLLLAVSDLSWLLTKGYALESSLKLVGDRFKLTREVRKALKRGACSNQSLEHRKQTQSTLTSLRGCTVWIDGFNLLITLERALRGDPILLCRDGVIRDVAGVHGTYRKGKHTLNAFELIIRTLHSLEVEKIKWFFDQPVSNSGQVAQLARQYKTEAEVVRDPDFNLIHAPPNVLVISGDGLILERCTSWFNLAPLALKETPTWLILLQD